MKKLLSLFLALILSLSLFSGCGENSSVSQNESTPAPESTPEPSAEPVSSASAIQVTLAENIPDDNCRNWYEIFVYSFADSDGDGIGDLRGAAEKLEYIRDLGCTGIWLMPIMPSPSYHKYDVTDYYDIDPQYGTLEDFQAFLDKAHELDIQVIIDLVVNHTSSQHPWFVEARSDPDSPYREYYNFQETSATGYAKYGDWYYEARFVDTMPDLNLDSEAVRAEIVSIMEYWLTMGVDGFRLDACTSFYTDRTQANVEFLSWLNKEAKAIDPGCYLVGEAWTDDTAIAQYYESGIDSFFMFPLSSGTGKICKIVRADEGRGESYSKVTANIELSYGTENLMAPFLDNHDNGRIANAIGTKDLSKLKIAYGMLTMMRGGIFLYYGSEIGMVGTGDDPNKRIGMLWTTEEENTKNPPGVTKSEYRLPSAADQQADENSLYNYVKSCLALRNALPAIARGSSEIVEQPDMDVCIIRRSTEDETLLIVLNLGDSEKSLSIDSSELLAALDADLSSGNGITFASGVLSIDPLGIVVFRG